MLQRLRNSPPVKVGNPLMQIVQAQSIPLTGEDWPQVKAATSPPGTWAAKVDAEREAAALAYHKVALQWDEQQRGMARQETTGETMLARELNPLEYQLDGFACSIGLSLTAAQLKALAAGAVLSVEGVRYRGRIDGCLYQEKSSVALDPLGKLHALWERRVSAQLRQVGEHLRKEAGIPPQGSRERHNALTDSAERCYFAEKSREDGAQS